MESGIARASFAWTAVLDKSRNSKSTEVGRIWEVYDEFLQVVPRVFLDEVSAALGGGDSSCAWRVWSFAAEVSLLSAFQLAGGPTPDREFKCWCGVARFRSLVLGGPVVEKARADFADSEDGQFVHLGHDRSVAFCLGRA